MRKPSYPWIILAAGFFVLFLSGGASFAFGLMLKPMAEDLQWSRSSLSLAVTVFMLVSALTMAPVGRLVDRYGPRWIIAAGAIASALGIGLTGYVNAVWQLFVVYGTIYAIGHAAASIPSVAVMVSHWFKKRRGLASGAVIGGNAIGRLVIIGLLTSSLSSIGWRMSYLALGIAIFVVIVPICIFVIRSPSKDSSTDSKKSDSQMINTVSPVNRNLLASRQLWLLMVIYAICGMQDYFMATHVVAFALDKGIGNILSGNLLALMGVMGLIGVLASGVLADKFGAKNPTTICFILRIAIFAPLLYFDNTASIIILVLVYGITMPITAPLTVVFAGNMFGTARLGTVSGILNMVHQGFGGAGAILGALIFDRRGDYREAFLIMLLLTVICIAATLLVREKLITHSQVKPE